MIIDLSFLPLDDIGHGNSLVFSDDPNSFPVCSVFVMNVHALNVLIILIILH